MSESQSNPHPKNREQLQTPKLEQQQQEEQDERIINECLCDFCGESKAILYCRADSAKLCFACDREVHSTNQLFTKHTRSQLCDVCDTSPASILCSTENLVLCQNCDWETHNKLGSTVHNRRPLEGFNGCPSVSELCSIVGFEDLDKKSLFFSVESGGGDGDGGLDGSGDYAFSDMLVWETPSVFSLDDLIGSTDDSHGFQAMDVPPLRKNRNAGCGQRKEEILRQLREMAKLEPDLNYDHEDVTSLNGLQPIVPEQNKRSRDMCMDGEHDADQFVFPAYEASAFQWCSDSGEGTNQYAHSTLPGSYNEDSCLVPEKHSDIGGKPSHAKVSHEGQSQHPIISETLPLLPKVSVPEFNSQVRDTALSRYKEKKKIRRYDRHIRYESRKARAESRTRIKGRFAKINQ